MSETGGSGGLSRRAFMAAGAALVLAPSIGRAQALAGRRIPFLIGNEGAGGYEAYARLFAKHLALALPSARVTVEVVPAADGRLAAKRIAEAPAGDLTMGLFETALLYSEIEKDDLAPITLAAFKWIGKLAVDERLIVASARSGIKSIEELAARTEPAIFPASTIVSRSASECYLLDALLGLPMKPVPGYDGAQRGLAFLSGEGQVIVGSYPSQARMIASNDAVPILRLNAVPNPSVPATVPLLRDVAPAGHADLIELVELSNTLGRWIAAPPSIADDDLAILRAAFDKVTADPDFLAEARTQKLGIDAMGGAQVQEKLGALLARKQQLRGSLAAALDCGRRRADGARSC